MIKMLPVSLLDWLVFTALLLVILLVFMTVVRRLWQGKPKRAYQQKLLFSPQAAHALRLLDEAVGSHFRVFAAVSVHEFIALNPALKKAQREQAWHNIYGETLDFVLCSPQDLRIRVAVVLTDESLSKAEQRKQQQLWYALQTAGLTIVDMSAKAWPSISSLRADILTACKAPSTGVNLKSGLTRVEPVVSIPQEEQEMELDALQLDSDEPQIKLDDPQLRL